METRREENVGHPLGSGDGAFLEDVDVPLPLIFRPVELNQEIATYIRDLIMSARLAAGTLVNIDRLARDLNISTTPVREALQTLRGEGFVQFEPRRGFRTAPLSREDIQDLFLVYGDISGELAARAAERITPGELSALRDVQHQILEASHQDRPEEVANLNFEFHKIISDAAASPKLTWLVSIVYRYVPRRAYWKITRWADASTNDHDSIIEALMNQDAKKARSSMVGHINHASDLLTDHLEQLGLWSEPSNTDPPKDPPKDRP